jgi:hypothetical protein
MVAHEVLQLLDLSITTTLVAGWQRLFDQERMAGVVWCCLVAGMQGKLQHWQHCSAGKGWRGGWLLVGGWLMLAGRGEMVYKQGLRCDMRHATCDFFLLRFSSQNFCVTAQLPRVNVS